MLDPHDAYDPFDEESLARDHEEVAERPSDLPQPLQPPDALELRAGAVINTRRPLRVLPRAVTSLNGIRERLKTVRGMDYLRLQAVIASMDRCLGSDGMLWASMWHRHAPGRIQLRHADVQATPKSMRFDIVPWAPGRVFVSADLKAAHVAVAAQWTGDALLHEISGAPGAYDMLGNTFLTHLPPAQRRGAAKIAVLATLNGARPAGIVDAVGCIDAAAAFQRYFLAECPGFAALVKWAKKQAFTSVPYIAIPNLHRNRWRWVERTPRPGTLLSAIWTGAEAEALDYTLLALPPACALVSPMYDGVLVECDAQNAGAVQAELQAAMVEGARRAGFVTTVKVGAGETWGEAEGLPR